MATKEKILLIEIFFILRIHVFPIPKKFLYRKKTFLKAHKKNGGPVFFYKLFKFKDDLVTYKFIFTTISVSEVHKKTGAEIVSNGIMGRNLGMKQKVPSPNSVPQYY